MGASAGRLFYPQKLPQGSATCGAKPWCLGVYTLKAGPVCAPAARSGISSAAAAAGGGGGGRAAAGQPAKERSLWVQKYAPKTFWDLLSDEQINRWAGRTRRAVPLFSDPASPPFSGWAGTALHAAGRGREAGQGAARQACTCELQAEGVRTGGRTGRQQRAQRTATAARCQAAQPHH